MTLDTRVLDSIIRNMPNRASEIVRTAAHEVESRSKQRAPVDTGALKNSLQAEEMDAYLWQVHDGVEYGIYQEFGTSRMAAHPFLVPAVESIRQWYKDQWKELFR